MDYSKINDVLLPHSTGPGIGLVWFQIVSADDRPSIIQRFHQHDFYEIHFILEGAVNYELKTGVTQIETGHYLMIPPGVEHRLYSISDNFVKLALAFELPKDSSLNHVLANIAIEPRSTIGDIEAAVNFCLHEAKRHTGYSAKLIANRIFELIYLIAGAPQIAEAKAESLDERLQLVKEFIEKNNGFISCSEAAKHCSLSERQLNRLFQKYEHVSTLEYMHRRRIQRALEMLRRSDLSIGQISETLGFHNEYYFNTFFKKRTGMTPGDYRRMQPIGSTLKSSPAQ